MTPDQRTHLPWAVPLGMLIAMLGLIASDALGLAGAARGRLFDAYERAAPRAAEDPHARTGYAVRYVDIDRESRLRYGRWPWPRAVMAEIVDKLDAAGAAVIVLAWPLDEPGRDAAERLLLGAASDENAAALRAALAAMPSQDARLAGAIAGIKSVAGYELTGTAGGTAPPLKAGVAVVGADAPLSGVPAFPFAAAPVEEITDAASALGALNLGADPDGVVRRAQLILRLGDRIVPSVEAEVLRLIGERPNIVVKVRDGDGGFLDPGGVSAIQAGLTVVPTAPGGDMWLYFSGPRAGRALAAHAILDGEIDAGLVRDAIVFLGAPDDYLVTPLGGLRPALEVRAEAMEQILLGSFLNRPHFAARAELAVLALFGAALVVLFARGHAFLAGAAAIAVAGGAAWLSWWAFRSEHLLIDTAAPAFGLLGTALAGLAIRLAADRMARTRLRRSFAHVLPAPALAQVARRSAAEALGAETREVSYLVCGVRRFRELSQSFDTDAEGLSKLMSRVLAPLAEAVIENEGALDRVSGDRLAGFWNAPVDDGEHALHACEAALRMTEAMEEVNAELEQERRADGRVVGPIEIGIGVATSSAIAAAFHLGARSEYSVVGDCVDLAAHIQAVSARYGPAVVVADDTKRAAERGFAFLEVDTIAADAAPRPVKLFALLGNPLLRASPKFRAIETFHQHIFEAYRAREWQKARALIEKCRALSGASQKLYDLYLARIDYFERHPPPFDWDGAFRSVLR